jgi:peptide/nickel transport system permease protein
VIGLGLTTLVVLVAVIGPLVEPYPSTSFETIPFATPSGQFLLGGDILGRDVLSRVLDGGWLLLVMAVAATAFSILIGGAAGISAAYLRGKTDGIIMRTVDVILAFPSLVFALLLVSIIGPKTWLIILAVGIVQAPPVARVLRSATLDISERDYVKAVELQGVRPAKVMRSEILPNLISPLMVETGLRVTYAIVIMAGLAFLGFGQPPPAANWGYMIQENRIGLSSNPWGVVAPAILIALLTIGTNTFTDAIARVAIGVDRRPEEAALIDDLKVGAPA